MIGWKYAAVESKSKRKLVDKCFRECYLTKMISSPAILNFSNASYR